MKSRWRRLNSRLDNPSRQRRSLNETFLSPFRLHHALTWLCLSIGDDLPQWCSKVSVDLYMQRFQKCSSPRLRNSYAVQHAIPYFHGKVILSIGLKQKHKQKSKISRNFKWNKLAYCRLVHAILFRTSTLSFSNLLKETAPGYFGPLECCRVRIALPTCTATVGPLPVGDAVQGHKVNHEHRSRHAVTAAVKCCAISTLISKSLSMAFW